MFMILFAVMDDCPSNQNLRLEELELHLTCLSPSQGNLLVELKPSLPAQPLYPQLPSSCGTYSLCHIIT